MEEALGVESLHTVRGRGEEASAQALLEALAAIRAVTPPPPELPLSEDEGEARPPHARSSSDAAVQPEGPSSSGSPSSSAPLPSAESPRVRLPPGFGGSDAESDDESDESAPEEEGGRGRRAACDWPAAAARAPSLTLVNALYAALWELGDDAAMADVVLRAGQLRCGVDSARPSPRPPLRL